MPSVVGSILRAAHREDGKPLNILTFPTHERYETGLCLTGHRFWAVRAPGIKDWNRTYAPLPTNYVLLNADLGDHQIPPELDFDLVLSQNKFGQFQKAIRFSHRFQLPLVSLEHTLPYPSWGKGRRQLLREMKGHVNVFISDFSRKEWGWDEQQAEIIHHGIDTDLFSPAEVEKKRHILSVVNDWVNRDWCCGFELWRKTAGGLPVHVVGDTPGLSKPAKSTADLVAAYREARIFLNTSLISPVPTALLEAMSCGCACVSTANCMIPEVIEHGKNGLISNDPLVLRKYLERLLADSSLVAELGAAARRTILTRFSMPSFTSNWHTLFHNAARIPYRGEYA